jgi:hypothetical protein
VGWQAKSSSCLSEVGFMLSCGEFGESVQG